MKNEFGKYLQSLRLAKKLGLRELARMVSANIEGRGVTHAYLSIIESGRNPPPRIPILHGLAIALEVSPVEMEMAAQGWDIIHIKLLLQSLSRDADTVGGHTTDTLSSKTILSALAKAYDHTPLSLTIPKCIFLDTSRPFVAFRPQTKAQRTALLRFRD